MCNERNIKRYRSRRKCREFILRLLKSSHQGNFLRWKILHKYNCFILPFLPHLSFERCSRKPASGVWAFPRYDRYTLFGCQILARGPICCVARVASWRRHGSCTFNSCVERACEQKLIVMHASPAEIAPYMELLSSSFSPGHLSCCRIPKTQQVPKCLSLFCYRNSLNSMSCIEFWFLCISEAFRPPSVLNAGWW